MEIERFMARVHNTLYGLPNGSVFAIIIHKGIVIGEQWNEVTAVIGS